MRGQPRKELKMNGQEIENALKIILKGVQQHTEIDELRNKMIQAKKDGRKLRVKFGLDPDRKSTRLNSSHAL